MLPVTIESIVDETSTVKRLTFALGGKPFSFLPGQWVNCYLQPNPNGPVAGYSMTSSPNDTTTIEIAVKLAGNNPVTHHIHHSARTGEALYLDRGQGDFYYTADMASSVVLIAGGIGITPLMSMLRAVAEANETPRATLLYSARSSDEFAFFEDIEELTLSNARITAHFTVTGSGADWTGARGRVDRELMSQLSLSTSTLWYICGPTNFITSVVRDVVCLGIPQSRIHYEIWT